MRRQGVIGQNGNSRSPFSDGIVNAKVDGKSPSLESLNRTERKTYQDHQRNLPFFRHSNVTHNVLCGFQKYSMSATIGLPLHLTNKQRRESNRTMHSACRIAVTCHQHHRVISLRETAYLDLPDYCFLVIKNLICLRASQSAFPEHKC